MSALPIPKPRVPASRELTCIRTTPLSTSGFTWICQGPSLLYSLTPGSLMRAEVTQASLAIQVRLVTLCCSSSVIRGLRSTSEEKTTMILAVDSTTVWTMRWMSSGELT